MRPEILARFWDKVIPATDGSGCLLWTGCLGGEGYGWLRVDGRSQPAHRLAHEHYIGPIPDGYTVDHVKARGCRHRNCVNHEHLEAVTRGENVMRGDGFAPINAAKTHCPEGHPYDEANTYRAANGWRACRACTLARNRARYWRNRDAINARARELRALSTAAA